MKYHTYPLPRLISQVNQINLTRLTMPSDRKVKALMQLEKVSNKMAGGKSYEIPHLPPTPIDKPGKPDKSDKADYALRSESQSTDAIRKSIQQNGWRKII